MRRLVMGSYVHKTIHMHSSTLSPSTISKKNPALTLCMYVPVFWSHSAVSTSSLGTLGECSSGSADVWHHVVSGVGKNGGSEAAAEETVVWTLSLRQPRAYGLLERLPHHCSC